MNVPTNIPGQVSNQLPQQNENSKLQNLAISGTGAPPLPPNMFSMDPELYKARIYMRQKIFASILQRQPQPVSEQQKQKSKDIAKRLEEAVFKAAQSKEDYMNPNIFESHLSSLIKRITVNNHSQLVQLVSPSSSIGTMIPTPGMPHVGNPNLTVSSIDSMMITSGGCENIAATTVHSGVLQNGYQQSLTNLSISSSGNISSLAAQRMTNQMIPTPNFNNIINHDGNNNSTNNQFFLNIESVNNVNGYSTVDSTMVSQPQQLKQYGGGQNNYISQNLGRHVDSNIGSNVVLNTTYASSPKLLQQHFNQQHEQSVEGDGHGVKTADSSCSETFCGASVSVGSMTEPQQHHHRFELQQFIQHSLHKQQNQQHGMSQDIFDQSQLASVPSTQVELEPGMEHQNESIQQQTPKHSQQILHSSVLDCLPITKPSETTGNISRISRDENVQVDFRERVTVRYRQFKNQQRWILFLCHARRCTAPEGKCLDVNCINAQKLLRHMDKCSMSPCPYPRCHHTRILIRHNKNCRDACCPVCIPVKNYIKEQIRSHACSVLDSGLSSKPENIGDASYKLISEYPSVDISEELNHSVKRIKIEHSSRSHVSQTSQHQDCEDGDGIMPPKPEYIEGKLAGTQEENKKNVDSQRSDELISLAKQEMVIVENQTDLGKQENSSVVADKATRTKSGKPNIKGVSLTELFTPEQVRGHIIGLRQWVGQSKTKVEKNQAMEHSMSENSCQLCAVEKLTFEPPPIYCTPCGARIKRNAMYYTRGAGETQHFFCIPCYNEARGDSILVDGVAIQKAKLEKKKNDEETEESWVQCDNCEAWQHQICALFNGRRNDGGQAEYTCPNCYIAEVERGVRKPLPQSAVLGAKDLPRTILSDQIEQRLSRRLKQERQERARLQGKTYDEVAGAEALVIRVVSSVDKKLDVKLRFLEIFREENYPTEFPYKSKVILLFQKIEGVEVCLFGMYVQEFGSESQFPNQRRVYLSYLDSVKYFRPEIKAVTGEALRTFVYHEILIGYLEYCKKRGFTSCYIWACPPLKGEDYILYCHPEIQRTPKSDKLREWYLSMLRKALKENIVVELTNLYDHFFISTGECKAKVTAARLPYFDGDYWPGAAEDLIYQFNQEEEDRRQNRKGTTKKILTKRALKASGQLDLSSNASKDLLLMQKLGETICPMKEDFIMVHLQHCCTHCCILMVTGNRWVCNQCKSFQICDECYKSELKREERDRHPVNQREKHALYPVEITVVLADTKDKDETIESEFFDTRQAFLSLCQGNHYQYDTLRRAKHSSMMVLYHLHNPTAPAFVTTCITCSLDIEPGQGWRCEVCPDYDVCNACYQKDCGIDHPHKLTNHMVDRDVQNKEARELRVLQLRKMLELLVHASQCGFSDCQYPNCCKLKRLSRHGKFCNTRASGGCVLCMKMWHLLRLHARACKDSKCKVPRCRDLKERSRNLQQQSDSRRRAAVMEMMRQRAAEVAGNSD